MPIAALAVPAAISAGGSILGGLFGKSAAQTAAEQQAQAAQKGMNIAQANTQQATAAQTGATRQIQGLYQPYTQAGTQGLGTLSQMLSTPGQGLLQGWNQQFQAPTAAQAASTPGYQFALNQGLNAMQNSAAARGTLLSGGTLKGLNNYAQGMASTNYQQVYNNAFNQYLNNQNTFYQNQGNQYQRLMGLTGMGANMTGNLGGAIQQGAGNLAGIYGQNTASMAQLLGAQGAAQASGTIGGANALQGMFSGIGNTAMNVGLLNYLNPSSTTSKAVGNLSDYSLPDSFSSMPYPGAATSPSPTLPSNVLGGFNMSNMGDFMSNLTPGISSVYG